MLRPSRNINESVYYCHFKCYKQSSSCIAAVIAYQKRIRKDSTAIFGPKLWLKWEKTKTKTKKKQYILSHHSPVFNSIPVWEDSKVFWIRRIRIKLGLHITDETINIPIWESESENNRQIMRIYKEIISASSQSSEVKAIYNDAKSIQPCLKNYLWPVGNDCITILMLAQFWNVIRENYPRSIVYCAFQLISLQLFIAKAHLFNRWMFVQCVVLLLWKAFIGITKIDIEHTYVWCWWPLSIWLNMFDKIYEISTFKRT